MKWMFALVCFLCLHDPLLAKHAAPLLRAFIICDSSPHSMKSAYRRDAYRMKRMLKAIAQYTKRNLRLQMCVGKTCSPRIMRRWIQSLPSSSQDIVFVYYSGQGCPNGGTGQWPSIKFPGFHACLDGTYREDKIAAQLHAKHPRLMLVFFDCYNQLIPLQRTHFAFPVHPERDVRTSGIKRLFLKSKGSVIACSALHGQPSFGVITNRSSGGLFTAEFLHLFQGCQLISDNWDMFCFKIRELRSDGERPAQRPYFEVNVSSPPLDYEVLSSSTPCNMRAGMSNIGS